MSVSASVSGSTVNATATSWKPAATTSSSTITAAASATPLPNPATVPAAPTWNIYYNAADDTYLEFFPPNDGGSPILSYAVYVDGVQAPPPTSSSTDGAGLQYAYSPGYADGTVVRVAAINAVGEGPQSSPVTLATI